MHLGEHHRGGEELPAVEGAPDAVTGGLGPVEHDHVVVELGIAVARIEVGEARGYHSHDVLLDAALLAGASVKDFALGVGEDLGEGLSGGTGRSLGESLGRPEPRPPTRSWKG